MPSKRQRQERRAPEALEATEAGGVGRIYGEKRDTRKED
jgi:hypothetical protein